MRNGPMVSNRWRAVRSCGGAAQYARTDIGAIEYMLDRVAYVREVAPAKADEVAQILNPVFKILTGCDILTDLDREQAEFDAS